MSARSACAALLLVVLALPASALAGPRWDHPWLPDRMFDYRHDDWSGGDPLEWFGWRFERAESTYEHLPDGSARFIWTAVIDIRDPRSLPEVIELGSLMGARNTRVEEFKATFRTASGTQELDRRRLVERSASQHVMYFDGSTVLSLLPPQHEPGRLVIHLQTFSEPHEGFEDYFGGVQFIQTESAAVRRVLRFRLPADQRLRFETRFVDVRPRERVRKGVREYTFTFDELLPMFPQSGMPPSLDSYPSILYSNQRSWEDLGGMVARAWLPHLESTPEMDAWAQELTAGLPTWTDKALAIHDAVADGWGYLGFYPGESGWVPHEAAACYQARLGDCKDRTALMVVLLRAAGVPADPSIIWSGEAFATPRVPVILANHAIVQAGPVSEPLFLDSVDAGIGAGRLRATLSSRDALVLGDPARLLAVPEPTRDHWLEEDEAYVSVQHDGSAAIFLVRRWHGQEANERKAAHAGPNRVWWEKALREQLLEEYPRASIEAITQGPDAADDQVWRLEVTLTSVGFVERLGPYGVVVPPWVVRWAGWAEEEERLHPRVLEGTWHRSSVRIFLPAGFSVVRAPASTTSEEDGFLRAALEVSEASGEVTMRLDVESLPGRIEARDDRERGPAYGRLAAWQDQVVVVHFPLVPAVPPPEEEQ